MQIDILKIKATFIEPLLGSASGNPEIHEEFIASKAPTDQAADEEIKDIPEAIEKSSTIFHKDEQGLHLWDYQVRGFIKESTRAFIDLGLIKGLSIWAHKRAVDKFIFVKPRKLYLHEPNSDKIWQAPTDTLQRPARVDTMQGARVCLSRSELLPVGTWLEFTIEVFKGDNGKSKANVITKDHIVQMLDMYGSRGALGQWRGGGYGAFNYVLVE